jgi:hypothetical protein
MKSLDQVLGKKQLSVGACGVRGMPGTQGAQIVANFPVEIRTPAPLKALSIL